MLKEKKNFWEQLIAFSMLVYLYFLSRRGGNSKDIVSILIMIFTLIYSYKEGIKRYLTYKKEIIISILYIILVGISYVILENKGNDRFYAFLHATLFSVGFMIVLLNYKLDNKYIKYIVPLLLIISLPSMYKGVLDFYKHYNEINQYRIEGSTYTTKYAAELGMYLLLGIFSIIYYKKIYIKLLLIPYILANLWLIFLTQSRNTFIAIPLTIVFLYSIVDWKKGVAILLILLCGIGILFKYNHSISNINRIKSTISTVEKVKDDIRYTVFLNGIERAKNNLIIGEGFYKYKRIPLPIESIHVTDHYHNNFIETAVTQGVLTLVVYIVFLITLFIRMLKNYFKENDRLKKYIKLYGLAVFIFSILYGLFESVFYFEKIYQLIFTIIAISFIIDDNESEIL
ncbi:O-antigen ligase family protein [Fusobacterium canifelinum]|uniref:O-antigen ligase family protein n=1 Tax=Fusobacterium canifelinum TaxID=285729 RepID=UPI0030D5CDAA